MYGNEIPTFEEWVNYNYTAFEILVQGPIWESLHQEYMELYGEERYGI